jgi:hypothetical protein
MKFKRLTTIFAPAIVLIAGVAALTLSLSTGVASASAEFERSGDLHLIKDCSAYTGAPGSSCTFISLNLAEIPVGSKIYVDQAAGIPAGFLDSDVMINVGTGDWAVGHCTLDLTTDLGLCRFSDGTGPLTGFTARVAVSSAGFRQFHYDGTYSFRPEPDR